MFWRFIGSSAAILTMFSFIPQIIKVVKTKSAKDVSLFTLLQLSLGVSLWIAYGLHLRNIIIITANSVTLFSLIVLLCFYFNYGRKR
ncbi:MAG: SemiSWEET transporter [Candidatus Omnitrophica bacterium]|nr:SemiSWEET transporter [Candidatus Omnitrophota bacterium]MDD5238530.1 SemiSWEET transporter [Candidatus Omnitrophota bacterium]